MKKTTGMDRAITRKWRPATQAVRGGTWRSEHGETSEALFLTSGYTFHSAGEVAARFAGEAEGMTYSRLQNPTVAMLEERIALREGAEACRAQASGMGAMTTALLWLLSAGDHGVAGADHRVDGGALGGGRVVDGQVQVGHRAVIPRPPRPPGHRRRPPAGRCGSPPP